MQKKNKTLTLKSFKNVASSKIFIIKNDKFDKLLIIKKKTIVSSKKEKILILKINYNFNSAFLKTKSKN